MGCHSADAGPAGTGKTESVKALGAALGRRPGGTTYLPMSTELSVSTL